MSQDISKSHYRASGIENGVLTLDVLTATPELSPNTLRMYSARMLKSLFFKTENSCMQIICSGDACIDNQKFNDYFNASTVMLLPEDGEGATGHPDGGFPFEIKNGIPVYVDESMLRFDTVFLPAGSCNTVELTIDELFKYTKAKGWVEVCIVPEEAQAG